MASSSFLLPMVAARASSFSPFVYSSTTKRGAGAGEYSTSCSAQRKNKFFDQIIDYIEGGPKLRKWSKAVELLPKDGSSLPQPEGLNKVDEVDNDSTARRSGTLFWSLMGIASLARCAAQKS